MEGLPPRMAALWQAKEVDEDPCLPCGSHSLSMHGPRCGFCPAFETAGSARVAGVGGLFERLVRPKDGQMW